MKEKEVSEKITILIKEIKNKNLKLKKFESRLSDIENLVNETDLKFEIQNLFVIVENFMSVLFDNVIMKNNLPSLENLDYFVKIYQFLQTIEGKIIPLLFFKFIF
jgi:hypothetical protein